jgi:hypothetical protein
MARIGLFGHSSAETGDASASNEATAKADSRPSMLSSRMIFGLDGSRMGHRIGTGKHSAATPGGCGNMAFLGLPRGV